MLKNVILDANFVKMLLKVCKILKSYGPLKPRVRFARGAGGRALRSLLEVLEPAHHAGFSPEGASVDQR